MFKTRLISGVVLVIIALITIMTGGVLLWLTLLACSLIGMQEIYRAMGIAGKDEKYNLLTAVSFLGAAGYYVLIYFGLSNFYMIEIIFAMLIILAVYVFTFPKYKPDQVMPAFFAIVYVAVMLGCIYLTRMGTDGKVVVWLIFLSSWGSDTCAYLVGRAIGKHKMAPVLSPKKSIEGAVGGVAGAALLGVIYAFVVNGGEDVFEYFIICAVGSLISMIGDLAASAIKRDKGIKDYGTLIPGHGGIMDRFDSVIFTAPIIYFLSLILIA